jgi:hypothetical protein
MERTRTMGKAALHQVASPFDIVRRCLLVVHPTATIDLHPAGDSMHAMQARATRSQDATADRLQALPRPA